MTSTSNTNTGRQGKTKSNRETIVVGPALTGFARVVKAGTQFNSTKPEYNLQLEFDASTEFGKESIRLITEAHERNIEFERAAHGNNKDIIDYGVPLKEINLTDATTNGTKRNPDVFTSGNLKLTAKSIFKPGLYGSLRAGDGGNSDLSGVMTHEIPVGSTVKVKLALISYFQEGDTKRGAKPVAGSSVKLQSVKILKTPAKKVFEDDTNAELLSFGETTTDTTNTNTGEFTSDFDDSTGIL